jgi:hypothetical protein
MARDRRRAHRATAATLGEGCGSSAAIPVDETVAFLTWDKNPKRPRNNTVPRLLMERTR